MSCTGKMFSHIYIEERAKDYPLTSAIMNRFPDALPLIISNYKDVFNRPHQDYQAQKLSQQLILAVKVPPFLHAGSALCGHDPGKPLYYATPVINCLYRCDYCFLQGMYPSSNVLIFVNSDSFMEEAEKVSADTEIDLSISYETDLLAMEKIVPFCFLWTRWVADRENVMLEIRTKSADLHILDRLTPNSRSILAWSLTPEPLIARYEKYTPNLNMRAHAVRNAVERGWQVRLCWDPLLFNENWEQMYRQSIAEVFSVVPPDRVYDVHLGVFRMNADYLKIIRKQRFDTDVLYYPFEQNVKTVQYPKEISSLMLSSVTGFLLDYIGPDKIVYSGLQ